MPSSVPLHALHTDAELRILAEIIAVGD